MKHKKLTKLEKALILLAQHIERCPYNDYKVGAEVINILGIELHKPKSRAKVK